MKKITNLFVYGTRKKRKTARKNIKKKIKRKMEKRICKWETF